jgi:hypothetical protein
MRFKLARFSLFIVLALLVSHGAEGWTGREEGPGNVEQFFDYWGFSIAPEPEQLGDPLELVGVLTPMSESPFPLHFMFMEYTLHLHGMTLTERYPDGPLIVSRYSGGHADFYRDTKFNAPFQYYTPATAVPPLDPRLVPARFIDGDLMVRMDFRSLVTLFYPANGIGSIAYFDTELRAVGGSEFETLNNAHMVVGWHMGGGFTDEPGTVPQGYGMLYDALIKWENPLPVEPATWGSIKAAFQ